MSRSFYPYGEHEEDGRPIPGPSDWWRRAKGMRGNGRQRFSRDTVAAGQGVEMAKDAVEAERRLIVEAIATRGVHGKGKRQDTTGTSMSSSASISSTISTAPLFVPPASTSSASSIRVSASSSSSSSATSSLNPSSSLSSSTLASASPILPTSPSASSRTFTSLWSTTRTRSSAASATPSFVPGVTFPLTLGGTRDDEAVYAVQVDLGHGAVPGTASYAWMQENQDEGSNQEARWERRQVASSEEGYQRVNLQVDLGSSDMWVATKNCTTSDCRSAPALLDASGSITSGIAANMTYHSGSVSGAIMWEEVQLDTFAIAYQAFVAGDSVMNENLGGGNFSGVLGMALPANSIISSQIPGTTSSNPDGATFLDNLFGSGALAPTLRIFSLALERREDVRTTSFLTIGSVYDKYCPSPCNPSYIPIIANPNLGIIGYLHWRIPLMGVRYTTWDDAQRGTGPSVQNIQLGPSLVVSSRSQPLAVLDSGGVAILVGHKPYADAIYGAYGISASPDGYYRMSCKRQLALSFNFGGTWYAAHPLDMSWPDPIDPSQSTCIGAIQYAPNLSEAGDFIFGSSFLKNVYTIFSYPDQSRDVTWQPTVGLIGLTNGSVASQDFYAVRTLQQSLAQVSSQGPFFGGASSPTSPSSVPITSSAAGGSVVNTTAIVAGSVVGFFVLAAVAFSAWWFFLRRKYGSSGYPLAMTRRGRDDDSSLPPTESTRRSKKHAEAHRQKSMIEGYSDYEGDSWTEGADSMRLGYLPEVPEEGGMEDMRMGKREGSVGSNSMRMTRQISEKDGLEAGGATGPDLLGGMEVALDDTSPAPFALAPPLVPIAQTRTRSSSRPPPESDTYPPSVTSPNSASPSAPLIPYPQPRPIPSSRRDHNRTKSTSLSMSGPFPSSSAWQRTGDLDNMSPMYEIRSEDYFEVESRGRKGRSKGIGGNRQSSKDRGQEGGEVRGNVAGELYKR